MRNILLFCSFFLILMSCNSDDDNADSTSLLLDTWSWESSIGGINGNEVITPEILGSHYTLILEEKGEYVVLENDNQILKGTYSITQKESIHSGKAEDYIQFNGNPPFPIFDGFIGVHENSFVITQNNYNGYRSAFKRATLTPDK